MNTCMDCGKKYERSSGIMICICQECLDKPKEPVKEKYIQQGKLLVPNK